ncbi:MAG: RNA polymerase sporulation sigma factor SigK [Clostridia bacterium]
MLIGGIVQLLGNLVFFSGYIANKNSFPQPLDKEFEQVLLTKMWAGDKLAREELIKHNMRLVAHIAKKYTNYNDPNELISVGSIGLVKAVNSYNKDKGTRLATYAAKCIENEILMTLRSNKKLKATKSLYEPVSFDKEGNEIALIDILSQDEESVMSKVENSILKDKLLNMVKTQLSKRESEVICLRYGLVGNSHTQKQVAEKFGISRSYVSRIETKALGKLKEYIDENKLVF